MSLSGPVPPMLLKEVIPLGSTLDMINLSLLTGNVPEYVKVALLKTSA